MASKFYLGDVVEFLHGGESVTPQLCRGRIIELPSEWPDCAIVDCGNDNDIFLVQKLALRLVYSKENCSFCFTNLGFNILAFRENGHTYIFKFDCTMNRDQIYRSLLHSPMFTNLSEEGWSQINIAISVVRP